MFKCSNSSGTVVSAPDESDHHNHNYENLNHKCPNVPTPVELLSLHQPGPASKREAQSTSLAWRLDQGAMVGHETISRWAMIYGGQR